MGTRTPRIEGYHPHAAHRGFHWGGTDDDRRGGLRHTHSISRLRLNGWRVNFPEVDLRAITTEQPDHIRVCHVHVNQPGVLRQVNEVLSPYNVEKQYSDSKGDIAYLMADIANVSPQEINHLKEMIKKNSSNILTRLLA